MLRVQFEDGTWWAASESSHIDYITPPQSLENFFGDPELAKEYRLLHGTIFVNFPKREQDLWYCSCSAINHGSEERCHKCGREFKTLENADIDALKASAAKRKDEAEQEERTGRRKTAITAVIAVVMVVIVVIAVILMYKSNRDNDRYNEAMEYFEAGPYGESLYYYEEAVRLFEELNGYRDSEEYIEKAQVLMKQKRIYLSAEDYYQNGNFQQAFALLETISDYPKLEPFMEDAYNEAMDCYGYIAQYNRDSEYYADYAEYVEKAKTILGWLATKEYKDALYQYERCEWNNVIQAFIHTESIDEADSRFHALLAETPTLTQEQISNELLGNWTMCIQGNDGDLLFFAFDENDAMWSTVGYPEKLPRFNQRAYVHYMAQSDLQVDFVQLELETDEGNAYLPMIYMQKLSDNVIYFGGGFCGILVKKSFRIGETDDSAE